MDSGNLAWRILSITLLARDECSCPMVPGQIPSDCFPHHATWCTYISAQDLDLGQMPESMEKNERRQYREFVLSYT